MRTKIQHDPMFQFDYFFRSRNSAEIQRRCKSLLFLAGKHIVDASARKERRDKSAAKKMKQLLNDRNKKLLKEQKMKEMKERRDNENAAKALRKEARAADAAKKRAEKSARIGRKGRKGRRGGVAKILPEGWSMIINVRKSGKYFKSERERASRIWKAL
tara:strand:+ start:59 stop:535 length:477 start_codon:yes stop_codon:yes gene_type:complete